MKVILILLFCSGLFGCASPVKVSDLKNIPLDEDHWEVVSTGQGEVRFQSAELFLKPKTPQFTKETFGAWVIAKEIPPLPLSNYVVRVQLTVHQQLRKTPNDWEVFWFLGNYRANPQLFKETNYFIAKPTTGGELGRAFQELGQEFLKTSSQPKLTLGKRTEFVYVKNGGSFKVYQEGRLKFEFHEIPGSQKMYHHPGTFGLYSEDASVTIHSFSYQPL